MFCCDLVDATLLFTLGTTFIGSLALGVGYCVSENKNMCVCCDSDAALPANMVCGLYNLPPEMDHLIEKKN